MKITNCDPVLGNVNTSHLCYEMSQNDSPDSGQVGSHVSYGKFVMTKPGEKKDKRHNRAGESKIGEGKTVEKRKTTKRWKMKEIENDKGLL